MKINRSDAPPAPPEFWGALVLRAIAVFLLVFGAKLCLIAIFGNATPYWDQWDGEAQAIYKKYLEGAFSFSDLFAAHNEHRIVFTRLISLALFKINGFWDPFVQMAFNALIHAATLGLFVFLMLRRIAAPQRTLFTVFAGALFCLPFGFENTLWGFQSQFYLLLLSALSSIWLCSRHEALSRAWWAGAAIAFFGLFTMASGLFAPAVSAALLVLRLRESDGTRSHKLAGIAVLCSLALTGLLLAHDVPAHDVLKAHGLGELLHALVQVMAWPAQGVACALFLQIPVAGLILWLFLRRVPVHTAPWLVAALGLWGWLQMLATAQARALGPLASRYLDVFSFSLCIQFAALCILHHQFRLYPQMRKIMGIFSLAWLALLAHGVAHKAIYDLPEALQTKASNSTLEEANTKAYLVTRDFSYLTGKSSQEIPYPSPDVLRARLDDPVIQSILPSNLRPAIPLTGGKDAGFVLNGYYQGTPPRILETIFGSYGKNRDADYGRAELTFASSPRSRWLELAVTGYPSDTGLSLVLTDASGRVHNLAPASNPREHWASVFLKVPPGPFTIHAVDANSARWLAFTAPHETGPLSVLAVTLKDHALFFMTAGLTLLLALYLLPLPATAPPPPSDAALSSSIPPSF